MTETPQPYKPIYLDSPLTPSCIRDYLLEFDFYIHEQCRAEAPTDRIFSYEETRYVLGSGNFEQGLAQFEEKFPGCTLNFKRGTVFCKPEVFAAVCPLPDHIGSNGTNLSPEAEALRESVEYLIGDMAFLAGDDPEAFSEKGERIGLGFAVLYDHDPTLVNARAFDEMVDFFSQYPEALSEEDIFGSIDRLTDNDSTLIDELETILTDELSDLVDPAAGDDTMAVALLLTINYMWDRGLKDELEATYAVEQTEP